MEEAIASVPAGASESFQVPPRWSFIRDTRAGAIVLIPIAAAISWAAWSGDLFTAFMFVGMGFIYGTPALLVVLILCGLSSRPVLEFIGRVAAQSVVVLVMSLLLLIFGVWIGELSIRASQRRGDRIVAVLEAYRGAHGTYPKSLAALEEQAKVELPSPTTSSAFMYERGKDGLSYSLAFSDGDFLGRLWSRNPETQLWGRLD